MVAEKIPPLPILEIAGATKKFGISQEYIDHILQTIYERRPDFFTRIAQRENDSGYPPFPNGGPNDALVQEFNKYIKDELKVDMSKPKIMGSIFWEMRRRSRVMYGLPV